MSARRVRRVRGQTIGTEGHARLAVLAAVAMSTIAVAVGVTVTPVLLAGAALYGIAALAVRSATRRAARTIAPSTTVTVSHVVLEGTVLPSQRAVSAP